MQSNLYFNHKGKAFLLICLALCIISSCSGSQEQEAARAGHTPTVHTIEIVQLAFKPAVLLAKVGDSVIFINKDMVDHDITDELNTAWTSGILSTGQSWKTVVTQNENYFCSLHVVMKGKIQVAP